MHYVFNFFIFFLFGFPNNPYNCKRSEQRQREREKKRRIADSKKLLFVKPICFLFNQHFSSDFMYVAVKQIFIIFFFSSLCQMQTHICVCMDFYQDPSDEYPILLNGMIDSFAFSYFFFFFFIKYHKNADIEKQIELYLQAF